MLPGSRTGNGLLVKVVLGRCSSFSALGNCEVAGGSAGRPAVFEAKLE
jgi:hypothetical protein